MAERVARLDSFYKDADGRFRRANAGDTIQVAGDFLDRFDTYNVLQGEDESEPEEKKPVKRSPRAKKADDE